MLANSLGLPTGFIKYVVVVGVIFLAFAVFLSMRPTDKIRRTLGGKVIGIVGRMGSGKTYMSIVIAYGYVLAGHDVRTNFTMKLPKKFYDARISTTGVYTNEAKRAIEEERGTEWWQCFPRISVPWEYFTGWEQFADLSNCVVIIDECQLYAPSYKPLAFPLIARWKLAMARKFHLDVYWISQHEDRVNSTLKHLTNMIYVCNAWFGAKWFSAKGYEPEYVRRKGKHIARRSYRFNLETASLYDTLEILTPDEHLGDEKQSARLEKIHELAGSHNRRRLAARKAQSLDEVLEMAGELNLDTNVRAIEPTYTKPFVVVSNDRSCTGLTEGGITCGRPTDNANKLCDECIARAKASLHLVQR